MSWEKPRVLTTVGKKFLKPFAAKLSDSVSNRIVMSGWYYSLHMRHEGEDPNLLKSPIR